MKQSTLYHDPKIEAEFADRVCKAAKRPEFGPMDRFRLADELLRVTENGCGTVFALADRLAEFSRERGFPVNFRGCAGNLLLSHAIGLSRNTPDELGLRYESAFGVSQKRRGRHLSGEIRLPLCEGGKKSSGGPGTAGVSDWRGSGKVGASVWKKRLLPM